MSLGLLLLETFILLLVFLVTLNEYLLGAAKEKIRTVLFLLNLISVVAVFIAFGWIAGIITILLLFVFTIISTPLARYASFKILGFRAPLGSGSPEFDAMTSGRMSFDDYLEKSDKRREKEDARLAKILSSPKIKHVMNEYGESEDDLEKWRILLADIFWEVISNPNKLRMLLELKRRGVSDEEVVYKMRQIY